MTEKYPKIKDDCFSSFKDRSYDSGVEVLKLLAWQDFHKIVEIFNDYKDYYIWRGQYCSDMQLISSFDRGKQFTKRSNRKKELNNIRNNYKDTYINNFQTENALWTRKQHYGPPPTPLLDWTTDPYIASYFAFQKQIKSEQLYRVVYALNKAVQRLIMKGKNEKKEIISREKFIEFINDFPNNLRAERQKAKSTKALNGIDIKEIIFKYSNKRHEDIVVNKRILLVEIFIPNKFRSNCLLYLEKSLNINHDILFPD